MNDSPAKEAFQRFKESKLNLPVAFLIVLLLDIVLLWASVNSPADACLAGILISLISVFGFVWLGVKEPKKVLISMTVVFLILSPVYATMYTDALYSLDYPMDTDPVNFGISQVDVRPYVGSASTQSFNFTATVPGNASDTYVRLKVMGARDIESTYYDSNMSRINGSGSTMFYSNVELGPGTYVFRLVVYRNGSLVNGTDQIYYFGPQNLEKSEFFTLFIPYSFITIFLQTGGLAYILAGMYWWTRIARGKKKEALTVRKEEGEMAKCPVCEHKIPYGTRTCPYCGAELEYDEENKDEKEEAGTEDISDEAEAPESSGEEKEENRD